MRSFAIDEPGSSVRAFNATLSLGTLNWPIFIIGFMWMKLANLSKCFLLWTPLAHFVQQKSDIFYTLPLWGGECRHDIFLFNCPSSGSLYSSLWLCHWRDSFLFRAVGTVVPDELFLICYLDVASKGRCQKRFSGFFPLKGYPPGAPPLPP